MNHSKILEFLQRADLMGTGCVLNDGMEDEYEPEAAEIARRVNSGEQFRDSVIATFDDQFWPGCLDEGTRSTALDRLLQELPNSSPRHR
jgi:hypothetical protein